MLKREIIYKPKDLAKTKAACHRNPGKSCSNSFISWKCETNVNLCQGL